MTHLVPDQTLSQPIGRWLRQAIAVGASDIHLVVSYPPVLRTHGQLETLTDEAPLTDESIAPTIDSILPDTFSIEQLNSAKNFDYAIEAVIEGIRWRFRVNLFVSNRSLGACIRLIPCQIPDYSWTGFPEDLANRIASFPSGLILFTGVTGSGKSTSLALIIELLNRRGGKRILTIEDPIEYQFSHQANSVLSQREVGDDVASFYDGLKYGLRQDPDVLFVGEIRDLDTAKMALSASETGHLVLSTLHTRDAKGAISRYADFFPQESQNEIRSQLASGLRCVVCQRLLPSSIEGEKQELAIEVLFNSNPISSSIRSGKLESIDNYILTGRNEGMQSMDESIKRLLHSGKILQTTAETFVSDRSFLFR